MWEEKKSDFQHDVHPKTWLKPYRNNSITHILKMAVFYHVLGLMLASLILGAFYVYDPDYEIPLFPIFLVDLILAGPMEETVHFGIPYYLTGNQYVMLATGIIWAFIHLPVYDETSEDFEIIDWDYALFSNIVIGLFFTYRAWLSGKGWLSILIHSAWNGGLFGVDCMFDQEFGCSVFGETPEDIEYSIGSIIFSVFLLGITYWAYRWRKKRDKRKTSSEF